MGWDIACPVGRLTVTLLTDTLFERVCDETDETMVDDFRGSPSGRLQRVAASEFGTEVHDAVQRQRYGVSRRTDLEVFQRREASHVYLPLRCGAGGDFR